MLKGIFSILIGMLLVLLVMFGKLKTNSDLQTEEKETIKNSQYHLQLIVQNTDEYFWTKFQEGAKAAEQELGVYIEFVEETQRNTTNLREAVEMGVNAGVDGIAFQAADSEQTVTIIEGAKEQGIAVVIFENDNFIIPNTSMVGTNSYSLGYSAGDMAVKASSGHAKVAVIINNSGDQGDEQYKNMIIEGILDSFTKYSTIDIKNIYTINADMFEAEKVAASIIADKSKVDFIICMDEKSTPGIAQILVDNNMVGDINLIGYGVMLQTLDYIERGVIYGVVCPNAYEIGYNTVKQLVEQLNGDQISDYISTELFTIDSNNVERYGLEMDQN